MLPIPDRPAPGLTTPMTQRTRTPRLPPNEPPRLRRARRTSWSSWWTMWASVRPGPSAQARSITRSRSAMRSPVAVPKMCRVLDARPRSASTTRHRHGHTGRGSSRRGAARSSSDATASPLSPTRPSTSSTPRCAPPNPKMFDPAYTAMRTTLVDAAASWPTKLHAVAELAWAAHVHETLPAVPPQAHDLRAGRTGAGVGAGRRVPTGRERDARATFDR